VGRMSDVMGVGEKTTVLTNKGVTTIVAKQIIKTSFPRNENNEDKSDPLAPNIRYTHHSVRCSKCLASG